MWSWLPKRIGEEPVLFQAVIQAAIALAVSFGLKLEGTQVGAITALSAAVLSFITRSKVTPLSQPQGFRRHAVEPAPAASPLTVARAA